MNDWLMVPNMYIFEWDKWISVFQRVRVGAAVKVC